MLELAREFAGHGKRQGCANEQTHLEYRSFWTTSHGPRVYNISDVILTAGKNVGWVSWTRERSR